MSVIDDTAVTELELYADNDSALYGQRKAFLANMARKMKRGTYDRQKGQKLWGYFAKRAADQYTREFGNQGDHIFGVPERKAAAVDFEEQAYTELKNGEYPDLYTPGMGGSRPKKKRARKGKRRSAGRRRT